MNGNIKIIALFLFLSSILYAAIPWGFYAHKRVNRYAVFTLPEKDFHHNDLYQYSA